MQEPTTAKPTHPSPVAAWRVRRDNGKDLQFQGVQLAHVSSRQQPATVAGVVTHRQRWTEIALYRTQRGTFVAEVAGHSTHPGERTRCSAYVAAVLDDLVRDLAADNGGELGPLAKSALEDAGLECFEVIE
jgi:hypothetical protein